jgi:leucyl/phenylalanyl-tRNA--protein transferase
VPVEPSPSPWDVPDPRDADDDLVGVGADLQPGTLLAAYRRGIFPMPEYGTRPPMHWFSPVHRGIVPLDGLVVSRSLRRSCREFELRVDTAFDEVVAGCGDPARDAGWITRDIAAAYGELHRLGWAHSVEAWQDGELAGGLYGVGIGGLFAGESMFHRVRDASKVALVGLVSLLTADGVAGRLLDVQWVTPHLATLGAVEVPRAAYLRLLEQALLLPAPAWEGAAPEVGPSVPEG